MKGKTMNKTELKKKIKHYAPEILVGVTLVAGAVATLYIVKECKNIPDTTNHVDDTTHINELLAELASRPKEALIIENETGSFKITNI